MSSAVTVSQSMEKPRWRPRRVLRMPAAPALALFLCAGRGSAAGPGVDARLACSLVQGIVLCAVDVAPSRGAHVTWAEAKLVSAPPFTEPVRTKATFKPKPTNRPLMYLALAPKGPGKGEVVVVAHAVVCSNDGASCPTRTKELKASITVPR